MPHLFEVDARFWPLPREGLFFGDMGMPSTDSRFMTAKMCTGYDPKVFTHFSIGASPAYLPPTLSP
jgi:hypothetical protein